MLCENYGLCNIDNFKAGFQIPNDTHDSELLLSDYYKNVSYDLDMLISAFDILTTSINDVTNTS